MHTTIMVSKQITKRQPETTGALPSICCMLFEMPEQVSK